MQNPKQVKLSRQPKLGEKPRDILDSQKTQELIDTVEKLKKKLDSLLKERVNV